MRTIKLTLLLSFILFSIQIFSQNNQPKTPQERTENQLKRMTRTCNLTKEQTSKVEKILLNTNTKMEEIRAMKPTYKGERLEKMKAVNEEQDTQLKAVLTAEQYQIYIDAKEVQKEKAKERMQNRKEEK